MEKNNAPGANDVLISKKDSPVKVITVTVKEELEIAREVAVLIENQ